MTSFTHIASASRDRLFRLAERILGNGAAAEDVVQEVLISGWEDRKRLVSREDPPSWLLRMTRNRAIDHLRSQRARDLREAAVAAEDHSADTPHRRTETADTLNKIEALINQLPDNQRRVLRLREVHHLSYQEIGRATGLSPDQVKVYLHRARLRLRDLLLAAKIVAK